MGQQTEYVETSSGTPSVELHVLVILQPPVTCVI